MNQRATEYDLNDAQFEQLIDRYITTVVDSMSTEDFREYVRNDMWNYLSDATFSDINFILDKYKLMHYN